MKKGGRERDTREVCVTRLCYLVKIDSRHVDRWTSVIFSQNRGIYTGGVISSIEKRKLSTWWLFVIRLSVRNRDTSAVRDFVNIADNGADFATTTAITGRVHEWDVGWCRYGWIWSSFRIVASWWKDVSNDFVFPINEFKGKYEWYIDSIIKIKFQ